MAANRVVKDPLWATLLLGALVAAMGVSFFVFVQSGEAEQVTEKKIYEPQIIGGTEVPNGKYPFMAFIDMGTPKGYYSWCGATLIDRDSLLTAAHCFYDQNTGNIVEGKLFVRAFVGRTVRSSNQGQMRFAKQVYLHPDFKGISGLNLSHDAAVIELRSPVSGIQPIKLATSKQNSLEKPGRKATVAGWGNTIAEVSKVPGGPENPDRMHEAQVPIVSDSHADKAWKDYRLHNKLVGDYVPPLMVAAGGNDKATCQGDSGGPLFVARAPDGRGDNGNDDNGHNGDDDHNGDNGGSGGKYTQIGITSFSPIGCVVKENIPAGYTEVNNPSIRNFITNKASK
jgi:secreted trypsin-like serine protease